MSDSETFDPLTAVETVQVWLDSQPFTPHGVQLAMKSLATLHPIKGGVIGALAALDELERNLEHGDTFANRSKVDLIHAALTALLRGLTDE